jgi:hypothetical protein
MHGAVWHATPLLSALKQRGAKYYENYMRKRKLRGGQFLGPPLGPVLLQQEQQQQQQQQQQDPSLSQQSPAGLSSALTPAGFRSLLDQCLLATAQGPVDMSELPAFAVTAVTETQQQQRSGDGIEQLTTAAQQQQQQQQQLRQPWQFQDYVPADLAKSLLPAIKRKQGVTVHPPELSISEWQLKFLACVCVVHNILDIPVACSDLLAWQ